LEVGPGGIFGTDLFAIYLYGADIEKVSASGAATLFAGVGGQAETLAFGSPGNLFGENLFVAEDGTGNLLEINPDRTANVFASGFVGFNYGGTTGLKFSADKKMLFVTDDDAGIIYNITFAGAQFTQQGPKLIGTGIASTRFGSLSVSLSGDGNTAIVGRYTDNELFGGAWVFTRSGELWNQQGAKLVGTDVVGSPPLQGFSVSLSGDGNTAIVGGPHDNNLVGAAWVFTRSGGVWSQQAKLIGTDTIGASELGYSVSLSGDGNTAIVGGPIDDNSPNGAIGAAWVFTRSDGVWSQQAKLIGTDAIGQAAQGVTVSLSGDGNTALVGSFNDSNNVGAAWVFTRSGKVWSQQAKLIGADAQFNSGGGFSVSLSGDGNTAIIGRGGDNNGVGAAWVFTRSDGVWSQQAKLVGTDAVGLAYQGVTVSLSGDGNTALVGGPVDNNFMGAAWVFTRSDGVWSQPQAKLVGMDAVGTTPQQGRSVALSADGRTAIVGGNGDNGDVGAAWVFAQPPLAPVLDDFNRRDGNVGNNWALANSLLQYKIVNNSLDVQLGGALIWKSDSFGASQEAFMTLTRIAPHSPTQGLLLKAQASNRMEAGVIIVVYDALAKAVRVSTLRLDQPAWTNYGKTPVTFANGDQLGARVSADGTVEVYQNDTLIATVTLTAKDQVFFNSKGGRIGIWTLAAPTAVLDDFGGGDFTP